MRITQIFLLRCLAVVLPIVIGAGCGGVGANSSVLQASLRFSVDWPERGRMIPVEANSIRVEISIEGEIVAQQVIPRPQDGQNSTTTTFRDLPPVAVQIEANAFPTFDGTGVPQAGGSVNLQLQANKTLPATVTMASTITSLSLTPNPIQATVGQYTHLFISPKDSQNRTVLVGRSTVTYQSSNPAIAEVSGFINSPNSQVLGVSVGNTTIIVSESESGKTIQVPVTVSPQGSITVTVTPNPVILAPNGTQQFIATVTGTQNKAVTWSIDEANGGSVTQQGLYTAPSTPGGPFHVRATSQADNSRVGTCEVTISSAGGPYTFLYKWGTHGSQDGQFNNPEGIAIDSHGFVYVADTGNNRIQKFDSSGIFISKWGNFGTQIGEFMTPTDVAVGGDGNVYVADYGMNRIQVFTPEGNFLRAWTIFKPNGALANASGVCVDSNGDVWTTESGYSNNAIERFTAFGTLVSRFGSPNLWNGPCRMVRDDNFQAFVVDSGNKRVISMNQYMEPVFAWGSAGNNNGQFLDPYGITISQSGNILVCDAGNNRLQVFSKSGEFKAELGSYGGGNGMFYRPTDVAVDSTGNIYVVEWGDRVQVFLGD